MTAQEEKGAGKVAHEIADWFRGHIEDECDRMPGNCLAARIAAALAEAEAMGPPHDDDPGHESGGPLGWVPGECICFDCREKMARAEGMAEGLEKAARVIEIPPPPDPVAVQLLAPYMWAVTCWAAKQASAIRALARPAPGSAARGEK